MDVHTKAQRSYNMSQVKSKNTKPELLMFSLLEQKGLGFSKHYPIMGKPDIVFPEVKLAVFIDGEFWHGKNFTLLQQTLSEFWTKKIGENMRRDRKVSRILRKEGWHIIRLWGRKVVKNPEKSLARVTQFLEHAKTAGQVS